MSVPKSIIAILCLLSASPLLDAYPITPRPLRKLCMESELIVVTEIGGSTAVEQERGPSLTKTKLHVSRVLKGRPEAETIYVYHLPGVICPWPPRYPEGKTVLAFLDPRQQKDGFYAHADSYGSKELSEADLKLYAKRIDELLEIEKDNDAKRKQRRIVEWLVCCAEEPATRWEGAYELGRNGDSMSHYDQSEDPHFARLLTEAQKARLASALFNSENINRGELCLVEALKDWNDERLIPFLYKWLRSENMKDSLMKSDVMRLLGEILGDQDAIEMTQASLGTLSWASDLIVVAKAGKTIHIENERGRAFEKTPLQLISVLKGAPHEGKIEVYSSTRRSFRSTVGFPEGKTILAFLVRSGKENVFYAHPLSGKPKILSKKSMSIYQKRIQEYLQIQEEEDPKEKQLVEWLVRCAEEPATRSEGAYALSPEFEFICRFNTITSQDAAKLLTDHQKRRLADALFKSSKIGWAELPLIQLVKEWGDERLSSFLLNYLKRNKMTPPYFVIELMNLLAEIRGGKETLDLAEQYERIYFDSYIHTERQTQEELRAILTEFIALIEKGE